MPSRAYEEVGQITGVGVTNLKPYSFLGLDRNRIQNFQFDCLTLDRDGNIAPFTGKVYLQGSQDFQGQKKSDELNWFDLVLLDFHGETKSIFLETVVEMSQYRFKCVSYNPNPVISGNQGSEVSQNSTIRIDGSDVVIPALSIPEEVADLINAESIPNITAYSDKVSQTLTIAKSTSDPLVVSDVSGSGLSDLGIDAGTYVGNGKINSIKTVR